MLRYFLVLAVTDGSLLVTSFVLGLLASGEPRGPGAVWRGVHVLFALLTTVATLAVHSIAYTYFLATGKWAAEVVRVYQLPPWINDQAKKNKRKAFRFEFWGMTAVAVTAWLGAGAEHERPQRRAFRRLALTYAVRHHLGGHVRSLLLPELVPPVLVTREQWEREWLAWPEGMFVGLVGGEVVGCAGLERDDDQPLRAENALTAVLRGWRGRGIARALKQTALAFAAANGVQNIYTWTQTGNDDMRALNERLGYVYRGVSITVRADLPVG